jgi:hypothetical protein
MSGPVKKYLVFTFVLAGLSSCEPLHFDMYIRNMTNDTTYLTLLYKTDQTYEKKYIEIKFKDSVLNINHKTREKLNGVLKVTTVDDHKMLLNIPPHSTICLGDLVYSIYEFAGKTLIFKNVNKTDTIRFNYPYRRIKGIKHKRNSPLNVFYRTILDYDIKEE